MKKPHPKRAKLCWPLEKEGADITATIRTITTADLPKLKTIIDATDLFPSDLLDNMMASYFAGDEHSYWFTYANGYGNENPVAIAYAVPEQMTMGTWNALLLAVHPDVQGQGIGATLMKHLEQTLREHGERILLVETSGLDTFKGTRAFYRKIGYEQEACIRDFYAEGEDKIVFRKALNASS